MNAIFLDIDGVLNNANTNAKTPLGYTGINNRLLKLFSYFVKETNAKIILSTSWKTEWDKDYRKRTEDGYYLNKKFKQLDLLIWDKIDENTTGSFYRGAAISQYLEKHPEITHYVILDDFEFDFNNYEELKKHWVQTKESNGFTKEDYQKALNIMLLNREIEQEQER